MVHLRRMLLSPFSHCDIDLSNLRFLVSGEDLLLQDGFDSGRDVVDVVHHLVSHVVPRDRRVEIALVEDIFHVVSPDPVLDLVFRDEEHWPEDVVLGIVIRDGSRVSAQGGHHPRLDAVLEVMRHEDRLVRELREEPVPAIPPVLLLGLVGSSLPVDLPEVELDAVLPAVLHDEVLRLLAVFGSVVEV